jgi:hypothetical protein
MPTTDPDEIARRRIAKQEARREERARLLADSRTRAPRVVKISVDEARTLDRHRDDPLSKNTGYCCFQCGHLSIFHLQLKHLSMCNVLDCECSTEDWDAKEQERNYEYQRAFLRNYYASSWRFWTPMIGFLLGGFITAVVWWFHAR